MERSSGGIRVFSDTELATLKVIECLKSSGMSIRDIKEFLGWCQEGRPRRSANAARCSIAGSPRSRLQIARARTHPQHAALQVLVLRHRLEAGTEDAVRDLPVEAIPEDLRDYRI